MAQYPWCIPLESISQSFNFLSIENHFRPAFPNNRMVEYQWFFLNLLHSIPCQVVFCKRYEYIGVHRVYIASRAFHVNTTRVNLLPFNILSTLGDKKNANGCWPPKAAACWREKDAKILWIFRMIYRNILWISRYHLFIFLRRRLINATV